MKLVMFARNVMSATLKRGTGWLPRAWRGDGLRKPCSIARILSIGAPLAAEMIAMAIIPRDKIVPLRPAGCA